MSKFQREKQAVFIVVTPADFKPQRTWDVAPGIVSGELFARNLSMPAALNFCRTFNQKAIRDREQDPSRWDHKWAIVMRHLKDFPRDRKGGAA